MLSITGQMHEKMASICFLQGRTKRKGLNYEFLAVSVLFLAKLTNERARISAVIVKVKEIR